MNIEDYADVLNIEIEIIRYPNQRNRYAAHFRGCEVKDSADSSFLTSAYGNGCTPGAAICDYLQKIRGKLLVVSATGKDRREYSVPWSLTA